MTYVVAIPTYNRSNVVATKTLAVLARASIPSERIYLFVADAEQASAYLEAVPRELYGTIVVGEPGIARQREYIRQYFPEGSHVVSIDDDVTSVDGLTADGSACAPMGDLNGFFEGCFAQLIAERLYLWGVYPVRNAFYMKHKITSDLRFIIGVLHGYIVRHTPDLAVSPEAESKEDVEQTLRYFLYDCGVLRYNHVACKTKFNAVGGLGTDRLSRNQTASEYICATFPEYTTLFYRKNGTPEVRLKRLPRRPSEMRRKTYPNIVTPYVRKKTGTPEVRMKRLARRLAPTRIIKQIHVRKCFTDAEMKTREKTYLTEADAVGMQFITEDCDVIDSDSGAILAHFRCNAVEDIDNAFYSNSIRFSRTGNSYKHKGQKTMTNLVGGYMNGYQPKQLYMFAMNGISPPIPEVRACKFVVDYPDKYEKMLPFFRQIDAHYKHVAPDVYKLQASMASETPFTIADTAFTTCTANVNYQTPIHKDSGDIEGCYGVLTVLGNDAYSGGQTCLPQYNIGFDVRKGCVLTMNVHEWHCNLPIVNTNIEEPAERLAVVCYLREGVYSKTRGLTAEFRDQHLSLLKNIRK